MFKFLVLACAFAMAYSVFALGTTAHSATSTPYGSTKTNGTCNVTQTYALPFTGGAGSGGLQQSLYYGTTTTQATTSASDWVIFCAWAVTETSTTAVSATFLTTPACSLYVSSGTAYALNSSLTTTGSVTTANTVTLMSTVPYNIHNATSSNFTKNTFTLYQVATLTEGSTAATYGTFGTGTSSNLDVTSCNTALKAFVTSFSARTSSIIASIFGLSFF